MKVLLLVGGLLVAAGGGAVLLARPQGFQFSQEHLSRLKGTDAYYSEERQTASIGPFDVRLEGTPETVLRLGITFTWRQGMGEAAAPDLVARRRVQLKDTLMLFLGDRQREEIEKPADMFRLKRELRKVIEEAVFPDGEARVDRLWFDPYVFTLTGS